MDLNLSTWGPMTVLAVAAALLLLVGGLVNVILGNESFAAFLNDVKPFAAVLGGGAAIGRGFRLAPTTVTARTPRRKKSAT